MLAPFLPVRGEHEVLVETEARERRDSRPSGTDGIGLGRCQSLQLRHDQVRTIREVRGLLVEQFDGMVKGVEGDEGLSQDVEVDDVT